VPFWSLPDDAEFTFAELAVPPEPRSRSARRMFPTKLAVIVSLNAVELTGRRRDGEPIFRRVDRSVEPELLTQAGPSPPPPATVEPRDQFAPSAPTPYPRVEQRPIRAQIGSGSSPILTRSRHNLGGDGNTHGNTRRATTGGARLAQ